jgi:hypothetical protein
MTPLVEVLFSLLIVYIISSIVYASGKSVKKINKTPFASGEKISPQRIQYLLPWLFYLVIFVAIDATLLLIALSAPSTLLLSIACLGLVLLSFLLIPWGEK